MLQTSLAQGMDGQKRTAANEGGLSQRTFLGGVVWGVSHMSRLGPKNVRECSQPVNRLAAAHEMGSSKCRKDSD